MHKLETRPSALSTPPSVDNLIEALSLPPASFVWTADNEVVIGASPGIVVQVLPHKVECMAIMAYDAPQIAQNNATLMLLILTALRPAWDTAGDWLAREMRQAKQSERRVYAGPNGDQDCIFCYDKQHSRATLTVKRV